MSETARVTSSAVVFGTDSQADRDAVVLVMHYDAIQVGGAAAGCTGTLLTPRLVLTARHCIADTDDSAACDSTGAAVSGGAIHGNHPASKLFAFVGNRRPDFLSGLDKAARGAEVIDDGAKTFCNHDIALLLLDRPLEGAMIAPLRFEGGPREGEAVTVVGFGVSDKAASPAVRQERAGVKVLAVGPGPDLGPAEFRVGEGGCAGDSGGPAIASSGAVLGVLSRGGNGGDAKGGDVEACIGAENVFTSVSKYESLIRSAYERAGQEPWIEGQPEPTAKQAPPAEPRTDGGCGIAPSRAPSFVWLGVVLALGAMWASRRRPSPTRMSS